MLLPKSTKTASHPNAFVGSSSQGSGLSLHGSSSQVVSNQFFPPTVAASTGVPHRGVGNQYEQYGSAGISLATVQQLANLQASFQQQIAALGVALSASTHLGQSAVNSGVSSDLPMYPENPVTVFPALTIVPYLSGPMGNSTGLIVGEKLNDQNYFF